MMKRTLLFCATVVCVLGAMAQSLNIHEGSVTYSYAFNPATTMSYGTNSLTINGEAFDLSAISSITGSSENIGTAQVYVQYEGAEARVVISGDLRGRVMAQVQGADVMLTDIAVETPEISELTEVTYHLSGFSNDGSFTQSGSYKCSISLEGISLQSSACPFQIENGKRIEIAVAEGTQNTFADGSNNLRKSAFWIKGHAEFTGAGTLNITGSQRHAYSSNEYTLLRRSFTGAFNILGAVGDGLHVDQYFEMRAGNLTVNHVAGDNIDVSSTATVGDEFNGQVIISGGVVKCTADADDTKCIKSETAMTINGGRIELRCLGNGSKGLSVGTNLLVEQDVTAAANASPYIYMLATGGTYDSGIDTSKCRGMKIKGNFTFNGGTIERDATSTVKSTGIISHDGAYIYKSGSYKNCAVI